MAKITQLYLGRRVINFGSIESLSRTLAFLLGVSCEEISDFNMHSRGIFSEKSNMHDRCFLAYYIQTDFLIFLQDIPNKIYALSRRISKKMRALSPTVFEKK